MTIVSRGGAKRLIITDNDAGAGTGKLIIIADNRNRLCQIGPWVIIIGNVPMADDCIRRIRMRPAFDGIISADQVGSCRRADCIAAADK